MRVYKIKNSPYEANAYLVNSSVLVDAGIEAKTVLEDLQNHIALEDLELIILTHCHFDHCGAAAGVSQETGARIAIHEADSLLLDNSLATVSSMFGQPAPGFKPDWLLKGGEVLAGLLKVIHTPGHTPGSICLYEPGSKSLFSGDTVFPGGSVGRTDLSGGDSRRLVESLRSLSLLDVKNLYPGHGEITSQDVNRQIKMSLQLALTL